MLNSANLEHMDRGRSLRRTSAGHQNPEATPIHVGPKCWMCLAMNERAMAEKRLADGDLRQ